MRRARSFGSALVAVSFGALCAHDQSARACELHQHGFTLSPGALALPPRAPLPAISASAFSLDVPIYHSFPTATAKVFLDFDGDFTPNWGEYHPGVTPAYSIDANTSSFSPQELDNIQQIWMRVAEKFSPWNIDVTTEDPGNRDNRVTMQVLIGGDGRNGAANYWPGVRAGGVSYVGSFAGSDPNTVFVFPGNLLNGDPKSVAEASAHETGHSFGLQHQSVFDAMGHLVNEYNPGNTQRAPIMGRSYDSVRGLWWYGTALAPNMFQDDYGTIGNANNGFLLRSDDHGNTPATATPLTVEGSTVHGSGIIEALFPQFNFIDKDYFSFHTEAGDVAFSLDVAPFGPMLDASLFLYDANGQLLAQSATASLAESLNMTLPTGLYYLAVTTAGNYGDVGQYFLSGTVVGVPEPSITMLLAGGLLAIRRRARV